MYVDQCWRIVQRIRPELSGKTLDAIKQVPSSASGDCSSKCCAVWRHRVAAMSEQQGRVRRSVRRQQLHLRRPLPVLRLQGSLHVRAIAAARSPLNR